jgi:hypothetical protein
VELTEQDKEENIEEDEENKGRTRNKKYQWAEAIVHVMHFQVELFNYFL